MRQPDKKARAEYRNLMYDIPTDVRIPGTNRNVRLRGMKPYTIERLTRLWGEREMRVPEDAADTLKSECQDPYFSVKCACVMVLNSYWGLRLLYPFKWRIWAFLRQYNEEQMLPIIAEGKKKLPLEAFWNNMVFLTDMRADWMRMTAKEAETFQAEQISAANRLSSKNTQAMESPAGVSADGSATGGTDAS